MRLTSSEWFQTRTASLFACSPLAVVVSRSLSCAFQSFCRSINSEWLDLQVLETAMRMSVFDTSTSSLVSVAIAMVIKVIAGGHGVASSLAPHGIASPGVPGPTPGRNQAVPAFSRVPATGTSLVGACLHRFEDFGILSRLCGADKKCISCGRFAASHPRRQYYQQL